MVKLSRKEPVRMTRNEKATPTRSSRRGTAQLGSDLDDLLERLDAQATKQNAAMDELLGRLRATRVAA